MAPQLIVDDKAAAKRWRSRRAATGLPLLGLALVNTVRLGVVDHLWGVAIGINAALIAAAPVAVWLIRRNDAAAMAGAPSGTLFAGGFSLAVGQLQQPRFLAVARALGRGRWGSGYTSGRLFLMRDEMQLVSKHGLPHELAHIAPGDLAVVQLTKLPAKINAGGLDLTFRDGSKLSVEVCQYDWLRSALPSFGVSAPE